LLRKGGHQNSFRSVLDMPRFSRRIKELEEQNRKLKEELKVAYGKLYERL